MQRTLSSSSRREAGRAGIVQNMLESLEKCFKASPLYVKFNVLRLTENMRLADLRADLNAYPEAL